ncbi:hypothetical protein HYS91_00545 [Candidatus Daviesbacteria bacterium]|nr:hypothetical protein [Candidatus Daviesbacteria bacterium]
MVKTLITHINPHLDDIVGIWLIKKFIPNFANASIEFISADKGKSGFEDSENRLYVGVGMGKYDEHKGDKDESAGSLVWKDIKSKNLAPKNELETRALDELVEWNTLIDTGKAPSYEFSEYSVQSFIRADESTNESSQESIKLGEEILNRVLKSLIKKQQSKLDWEERVNFESKFGQSFAVISETIDRAFCKSIEGDLFLMYDPKFKSVQYFSPKDIDLEPIYKKLKDLDPDADWFLHQSHHMVICGSGSAPDSKKTKLSFEQLIETVKTL